MHSFIDVYMGIKSCLLQLLHRMVALARQVHKVVDPQVSHI